MNPGRLTGAVFHTMTCVYQSLQVSSRSIANAQSISGFFHLSSNPSATVSIMLRFKYNIFSYSIPVPAQVTSRAGK